MLPASNNNLITLTGGAVELTGAVDGNNSDDALDNSFTITATGDITINNDINLGTGALTLTATGANIVDAAGVVPTLTAGTVSLTQMDAFDDALFTLADTVGALTLRTTGPWVAQTVHAWMVGGTNRALSITTTGVLTIGRNIDTGSGDLTLIGSAMTLSGVGARTLSGGTIKLQGPLSGDNALTVTAGNVLTLNNDINTGTGALSLSAASIVPGSGLSALTGGAITLTGALTSLFNLELTATTGRITLNSSINLGIHSVLVINTNERINLVNPNTVITAGGEFRINFTNLAGVEDETAGFTIGGSSTLGNLDSSSSTPTYTFAAFFANCTIAVCKLGNGTTQNLLAAFTLNAATSITIDIGTGTLTFGGRFVNNITIEAPTVSITAGNIDLGFRSLTITATNGALTLGGDIIRGGDDVMLSAAGGALILGGNISSSRNLTLSGMTIALSGAATTTIRLEGDNVTLTGALTANAPDLTVVVSDGQITLNSDINLGAGDLTLDSDTGIVLGSALTSLTGRAVTFTGEISRASGNADLTVMATDVLTFRFSNINIGTGALTLTAARISNGSPTRALTAGTVSLTQAGAFADKPFTIAASVTSLTLRVTGSSVAQTVQAWMVGGTNRALSLTTTGALTIGRNINTGSGRLTLSGTSIVLGGDIKLDGGAITLTGAIDESGTDALTVRATGALTLNDNINTGTGALTLSGTSIVLGGDIQLDGGAITLTGAINEAGQTESDNDALTITATGDITINSNINLGTGALILTATGANIVNAAGTQTLTASTVSLTQMGAFADNLFTIASATSLTLETTGTDIDQTVHAWMVAGTNRALSLTTTGALTIGRNINTGTGALTLTAGDGGTGDIVAVGTRQLTADTVSLRQDGAFADNLFTIVSATQLTLSTGAAQDSVYNWMVAASRALSLTSTGGSITVDTAITASGNITLTATTLNINADIGTSSTPITGSLTLNSDTLAFSGARTLSGANISLTGAATSMDALTIDAANTLTIRSNITIDGDLMLTGGTGGIVIGTATGSSALTWSGDAITLAGAVTTASTDGAANSRTSRSQRRVPSASLGLISATTTTPLMARSSSSLARVPRPAISPLLPVLVAYSTPLASS